MEYSEMERYWIWLSTVESIGTHRFYRLISRFEDARTVWENYDAPEIIEICGKVGAKHLRQARSEQYLQNIFDTMEHVHVNAITRLSDYYSDALQHIQDPPPTLYYRGNITCLNPEKAIGIVGSRRATQNGKQTARDFARDFSQHGVTVVSGLATGVDAEAHWGALLGDTPTIAVLGCGADIVYPPENDVLAERILEKNGAIISEYTPGSPPISTHFPPRNRIISGLSQGIILVEGTHRSGGMITVNFANDQGRDVFVIPGSIYDSMCEAPNSLLMDGANPALRAMDVLSYYHWEQDERIPFVQKIPLPDDLSQEERLLVEILQSGIHSLDELQEITELSTAKLNSHLTMLVIRGIIVKAPGGMYSVNRTTLRV